MWELVERIYFVLCLAAGRLVRAGGYTKVQIVTQHGKRRVRKHRVFYAPVLVWLGGVLVKILDAGVRVLSQREWEERERQVQRALRGTAIRIDADGVFLLPYLAGETLATVLEDRLIDDRVRKRAIEHAVVALVEFHRLGLTHADAMAENVLVNVEAGVAHWFDFETVHDSNRPPAWRRADDVRALLVTCLIRTAPSSRAEILQLVLDVYGDEEVTRLLLVIFRRVLRRPLVLHLAQAPLSFDGYRQIARLLDARLHR